MSSTPPAPEPGAAAIASSSAAARRAADAAVDVPARVRLAVAAALDTKAENVRVRHLAPVTSFADYFLVASGGNERQVQAIADQIDDRLRRTGVRPLGIEGESSAQWILLDYGDFVVHVFLEERRAFYGLERLWRDAPDVSADFAPESAR